MRVLKIILAILAGVLAVAAGAVVVVAVAAGFVILLLGRWLRRRVASPPAPHRRPPVAGRGEVIEVEATEVRADKP